MSSKMTSVVGWIRKRIITKSKTIDNSEQKDNCAEPNIAITSDKNFKAVNNKKNGEGDQSHEVEAIKDIPQKDDKIFERNVENFFNMDIKTVAHDITMMNWNLYRNITRENIEMHETTPSDVINGMNENFDTVYCWTLDTVLSAEDIKTRCRVIKHFILIARALILNNDLNASYAVISALQSFAIQRMDKTWRKISSNKMKMFKELSKLFSEEDNYFKLTTHMRDVHSINNICIPYLALFLKDFKATRYLENDRRILTLRRNAVVLEDVQKLPQFHSENSSIIQISNWKNSMEISYMKMRKEVLNAEANDRSRVLEAPKRFYRILNVSDINLAEY